MSRVFGLKMGGSGGACTAATWRSLLVHLATRSHRGISCLGHSILLLFECTLKHFVPESTRWEEFRRLRADSFRLASPSESGESFQSAAARSNLSVPRNIVCLARRPSLPVMQSTWQRTHIIFRRKRPWMPPQIKLRLDIFYYVLYFVSPLPLKAWGEASCD